MKSLKWKFIVGILIAALFLAYFFKRADIMSIVEKSKEANPLYLLIALFFVYLSYLIRSWRWIVLLRPLGNVSLWSSFKVTCIGFMFNNLIPRTGEIARPVLIGKKEGMSISSALATVFIERVLDFLGSVFLNIANQVVITTAQIDKPDVPNIVPAGQGYRTVQQKEHRNNQTEFASSRYHVKSPSLSLTNSTH